MSFTTCHQSRAPGVGAAISVRRFANEEIARVGSSLDDLEWGDQFEFLCECGDLSCSHFVRLTVTEYRALSPGFVLGHSVSDEIRVPATSQPPMPDAATLAFLCECGQPHCQDHVELTLDAYVALHDAGSPVLAPGHLADPRARSQSTRQEAQALRAEAQQIRRSGRKRRGKG